MNNPPTRGFVGKAHGASAVATEPTNSAMYRNRTTSLCLFVSTFMRQMQMTATTTANTPMATFAHTSAGESMYSVAGNGEKSRVTL